VKFKPIEKGVDKTFAIVFEKGDEVMTGLKEFAREHRLRTGHFNGIGALSDVVLGFFFHGEKIYKKIHIIQPVEVLSLSGEITFESGEPKVCASVIVGKSDGTAHGGHLLEAHVHPTFEMMLSESAEGLLRKTDADTGLALIDLDAA
jgi:predicted DNA-binding protein with PD1-like motif